MTPVKLSFIFVCLFVCITSTAFAAQKALKSTQQLTSSNQYAKQSNLYAQETNPQQFNRRSFLNDESDDQEEADSLMNEVLLDPRDFLRQEESSISNAQIVLSAQDKMTAAGHHYGKKHHGKYYEYIEVPKKGAFKAGFKRGNKKHYIMRKEMQHGPHNKGYFKWHDKKGKGMHKWDYNHYDKKKKGGHYHG